MWSRAYEKLFNCNKAIRMRNPGKFLCKIKYRRKNQRLRKKMQAWGNRNTQIMYCNVMQTALLKT